MRLLLICVGRPRAGPERDLAARYVERAAAAGRAIGFSGVELREAGESRAARPDDRKREEAQVIRGLLGRPANVIALDENGAQMTSRSLATELGRARDQGIASAAFVLGGPDGLEPAFFNIRFAHALLWGDDLAAPIGANHGRRTDLPGGDDSLRSPLSSRLIRELAGVLPRRRHFPLLDGVMG